MLRCSRTDNNENQKNDTEMEQSFMPAGYSSVSPYYSLTNANEFCEFLIKVFDAVQIARFDNEDGTIYHAEYRIYNSVIMITEAREDFIAKEAYTHVYVEDASSVFQKAIEEGSAEIIKPTVADGDTDERGMFQDKWGNVWAIATHNKEKN